MQYSSVKIIARSLTAFFILFSAQAAFAFVTVTPAAGGAHIAADTVGSSWTLLQGPAISEGASGDIGTGTIVFHTPAGFVFDTKGTAPTVLVRRISGTGPDSENINGVKDSTALPMTDMTSSEAVFTVTKSTNNGVKNSLTWQNLLVRPTAFSPLAFGHLLSSGTAIIRGTPGLSCGMLQETPSNDLQPEVLSVNADLPSGSYPTGTQIPIVVNFNESVTVSGSPSLSLMIGKTEKKVNYFSGSGTNELTFMYTVLPSDKTSNLDYASSRSLALDGGTIKDAATNMIDALLTLPAPGSDRSLGSTGYIALNTASLHGSHQNFIASVPGVVLGVSTTRFNQEVTKLVQIFLPSLVHVLLLH